jgi:hypothetical protein
MEVTCFIILLLLVKCLWCSYPSFVTSECLEKYSLQVLKINYCCITKNIKLFTIYSVWQILPLHSSLTNILLMATFRACHYFCSCFHSVLLSFNISFCICLQTLEWAVIFTHWLSRVISMWQINIELLICTSNVVETTLKINVNELGVLFCYCMLVPNWMNG